MQNQPRCIKKQLRALLGEAHKRELEIALSDLYKKFTAWQQNTIDCWDLNEEVHKFHNDVSRELYKSYIMSSNSSHGLLVAGALNRGVLRREEISDEAYAIVEPIVHFMNDDAPF